MNVIEIKSLYKSFGEVKAVNDLSFKVKQGELFAFLGVNGAGKSTTISMMCGNLRQRRRKAYCRNNFQNRRSVSVVGAGFRTDCSR